MVQHLASSLTFTSRPRLVGIVNITTDSFSDRGRFLAAADAVTQGRRLRMAGADIIELGPAASHPGAEKVTAAEEVRRLAGVIDQVVAIGIPVSVHSVQRHGPATKVLTDPRSVWSGIERFFGERVAAFEAAGISRERLIIDPGMGYFLGSNPEPSVTVMAGLGRLKARFEVPLLVSPSRKSFLRALTGTDLACIGPAGLAAELYAACQGVDFIRTHDVAAIGDALTIFSALAASRVGA